ncbi:MAG: right-handed parallel beta-helix repeat-containing protein [Pseudomonadota bacterium]
MKMHAMDFRQTVKAPIAGRFIRRYGADLALALTIGTYATTANASLDDYAGSMGLPQELTVSASCGLVIDQPFTTVQFEDDLYCESAPALTVEADDVTIDLNGKTLRVDDFQEHGWAILVRNSDRYTIRGNNDVREDNYPSTIDGNVGGGIGVSNSSHGSIYGITIKGAPVTGTGIGLYKNSYDNRIRFVDITAKSVAGMVISQNSEKNVLADSKVEYSNVGVSVESKSHGNRIMNTNFYAVDYAIAAILVGAWPLPPEQAEPVYDTVVVNNRIRHDIAMWGIFFAQESTGEAGHNFVDGDTSRWHIEAENISLYLGMHNYAAYCYPDSICKPSYGT